MKVEQARVYVVDDDPATRDSLTVLLHSHDFEAVGCASGESFLREFDHSLPCCVVVDLRMPGMSGDQLQQRMLSDGVHIPIIFLTGYADVSTTVQVMQQGAVTLLEKPYQPNELIDAVQEAIRRDREMFRQRAWRQDVASRLNNLTVGEVQVMNLMLEGKPNKAIAATLDVSMRTIDRRRRSVLDKMQSESVPELAQLITAYRRLEEPPPPS